MSKNRNPDTGTSITMPDFGICVSLSRNPATMLLLKAIGLDFVHIDLERSSISSELAADMIFAARAANLQPIIRLSGTDINLAQRLSRTAGVGFLVADIAEPSHLQAFLDRCAPLVASYGQQAGVSAALEDADQIDWMFSTPGITTVELDVTRLSEADQQRAIDAARSAGKRFAVSAGSLADLERWAQAGPAWITFSSDREIIGEHMTQAMARVGARH